MFFVNARARLVIPQQRKEEKDHDDEADSAGRDGHPGQ